MKPSIVVHGGAWDIPERLVERNIKGCARAVSVGHDLLERGESSLDAVEQAILVMEEDPSFNAGIGSVLNQAGEVEMDAVIMDGRDLRTGGVAALRHVEHPVSVARKVMDDPEVSLIVGNGALAFALAHGFERVENEKLLVGSELRDYKEFLRTGKLKTRRHYSGMERDTVGACALDRDGHVACATSTGGTPRKPAGRVGDSPIVGSGAYADDRVGAASATGWGERIMSVVLAKSALDLLREAGEPMVACRLGIQTLKERVDGYGGLVMVSRDGRVGYHHNSPRMAFAFHEGHSGKEHCGIRA
jgi:beta-aspartyl-peptidase (threonine type)